jgi:hypothetical protein
LRQIADIESDFRWWQTEFEHSGSDQFEAALAARYHERADILEDARIHLHRAFHELSDLPRLK